MSEQQESKDIFYDRVKKYGNSRTPTSGRVFSVNCGSMNPNQQKRFVGKMKESFDKMPQKSNEETGLKIDPLQDCYEEMEMPAVDKAPTTRKGWDGWKDKELTEPKKDLEITTLLEKVEGQKDYKRILALAGLGIKHQQNTFDAIEKKISVLKDYSDFITTQLGMLEEDMEQLKKLAVLNG